MNIEKPVTHIMTLRPSPFASIKSGNKVIEMRLNDEKRKLISVGDILSFENTDTHEIIYCEVLGLKPFPSFKEMYEYYKPEEIGYAKGDRPDYHDMAQYYSEEKIAKYGTLAIRIKLLK